MKDNTIQTKFQTSLTPWLMVTVGNSAREAEFYKAAFGVVEVYHLDDPGGSVVSRLSLDGASGMASEFWTSGESPKYFNFSPKTLGGPTVRMILHRWDEMSICI